MRKKRAEDKQLSLALSVDKDSFLVSPASESPSRVVKLEERRQQRVRKILIGQLRRSGLLD